MLGEQIKSLRNASGMSQVEMAGKLDVSKQSVCNWENNNIVPSVSMLRKICQLFACSADYLLEIGDDERLILDTADLSLEQAAHIRQIAEEYSALNKKIAEAIAK